MLALRMAKVAGKHSLSGSTRARTSACQMQFVPFLRSLAAGDICPHTCPWLYYIQADHGTPISCLVTYGDCTNMSGCTHAGQFQQVEGRVGLGRGRGAPGGGGGGQWWSHPFMLEDMVVPGATMSGLYLLSGVGPMELKKAKLSHLAACTTNSQVTAEHF